MKRFAIFVGLVLAIFGSLSSFASTRIGNDSGGSLGQYLLKFTKIRDSGGRVILDGQCFSACTLVTIIPKERICVTERAVLGFHAGWISDENGNQVTSAEGTRILYELNPAAIRIDDHGGLGARIILLKGRELTTIYRLSKRTDEGVRSYAGLAFSVY